MVGEKFITPSTPDHPEILWDDEFLELIEKDEEEGIYKWVTGGTDIFGNEYLGTGIYERERLLKIVDVKLKS
jgi:hypothetical protein